MKKWLEEGSVELRVTRINMHGLPASGKTCSQHLLLNEDQPPSKAIDPTNKAVTDSTPIACRAVKATRVSCDDGMSMKWERISADDLLERLASDLEEVPSHSTSALQQNVPTLETLTSSFDTSISTVDDNDDDDDSNAVCKKIIDVLPKLNKAKLSRNWLYIIDSGGQPSFQELLPLFTRAASLNIITIDLTKGVQQRIEPHYRLDGKYFPISSNDALTNIEFFKRVVSSGAITCPAKAQASSTAAKIPHQHPVHFVLGTHFDEVTTKELKQVNAALVSSLDSLSEKQRSSVIDMKQGCREILYPINTTIEKGLERDEAARKLCQLITNCCGGTSLTFEMPIRWFAFELSLQSKVEKEKRGFLTIDEVYSIGKGLQMNKEDTKEALQYLHDVTIILYYPQALPHIVFVDPQPILDILTHLLALTYVNRSSLHLVAKETPLPNELENLSKKGIFNEVLIEKLRDNTTNESLAFQKSDFIKLLLYLHIITKTEDGYYFIPCALGSYNGPAPEADSSPLLIVWLDTETEEILPIPHGIFSLTVVHLMNNEEPKLYFPNTKPSVEYFKYRDAISFRIFIHGGHIGTVHIINKYKHIEVYFTGDEPAKYCPLVRGLVTEAVMHSSVAVNIVPCHKLAFACPFTKGNCYCIITNEEEEQFNCTFCPKPATINNETPTVRGLAADNNNKLYTETMIFLWNNHYNLNFIM